MEALEIKTYTNYTKTMGKDQVDCCCMTIELWSRQGKVEPTLTSRSQAHAYQELSHTTEEFSVSLINCIGRMRSKELENAVSDH